MRDASLSRFFLSSSPDRPNLRIGLLLEGVHVSRASISVIEDMVAADFAQVELVLVGEAGRDRASGRTPGLPLTRWIASLPGRLSDLSWAVYLELDRRRVRLSDDPLSEQSWLPLLVGIPSVHLGPPRKLNQPRIPAALANRIRAARLDVIVCLGGGADPDRDPPSDLVDDPAIRDAAAHGVWAFHYGDPDQYRGGPALFWELVEDNPVSAVALERLAGDGADGIVLAKAVFPTDGGSVARNRVQPLFGSTHLVIQKLRELHMFGWDRLAARSPASRLYNGRQARYRRPTAWELARWIGPRLVRKFAQRLHGSVRRRIPSWEWRIAIRDGGAGRAIDRLPDMTAFRWIEAPPGHVYADPFLAHQNGQTWLFFEDLAGPERRGVITCAEVTADGRLGKPEVVLASDRHLSYPYVFFDGDTPYMIPETSAERTVRLYRSPDFPRVWEFDAELYGDAAVDTSVWHQDGRWWFFTTLRDPRSQAMALMLFFSDSLRGAWVPHPMNPISMDVRNARGAGAIFREDGMLIRPSQDCSRTYGYSFTLHEIVTLSTTEYEERPLVTVGPGWHPELHATHTYNRIGGLEVTDGKFRAVSERRRGAGRLYSPSSSS